MANQVLQLGEANPRRVHIWTMFVLVKVNKTLRFRKLITYHVLEILEAMLTCLMEVEKSRSKSISRILIMLLNRRCLLQTLEVLLVWRWTKSKQRSCNNSSICNYRLICRRSAISNLIRSRKNFNCNSNWQCKDLCSHLKWVCRTRAWMDCKVRSNQI